MQGTILSLILVETSAWIIISEVIYIATMGVAETALTTVTISGPTTCSNITISPLKQPRIVP